MRLRSLLLAPRLVLLLAAAGLVGPGCASWRLARLEPYPIGEPLRGPRGGYELRPPSDAWVRLEENEGDQLDLSLARQTGDAWLNVSVVPDRLPTAAIALESARARADALLTTTTRLERDVSVAAPEGELPARLGVYCGTFDREMRARDSCFVILAAVRDRTAYVLVGQVRVKDPEPGRQDELERFALSLRLLAEEERGGDGEEETSP